MTTRHPLRSTFASRPAVYVVFAGIAVAGAFAAGRYERDHGTPNAPHVANAESVSLAPSRAPQSVLTEAEVIAQHEAAITGVLGAAPAAPSPSGGLSEADVLTQHAAEINGVFGPVGSSESTSTAQNEPPAGDGRTDVRPIP